MGNGMSEKRVKSEHIYNEIVQKLVRGEYKPGTTIPGELQLAKDFNSSRATVSKALRKLEQEGLLDRKQGSGTYVRQVENIQNKKFGLFMPRITLIPENFKGFTSLFSNVIAQMSQVANEYDYVLMLNQLPFGESGYDPEEARGICRQLIDMRVKGVFFMPLEIEGDEFELNAEIAEAFRKEGIVVTLIDRDIIQKPRRSNFDMVCMDNEMAGYELTKHFISLGCKKIDFIKSKIEITSITGRYQGYRQALIDGGINPNSRKIHLLDTPPDNSDYAKTTQKMVKRLLDELDGTEALVCYNDIIANVIMTNALEMGVKIPDDLRLAGFDDEVFCEYLPVPLTTIRQPVETLGSEAVRVMVTRLDNPDLAARHISLVPELVVRKSCGAKS